MDDLPGGHVEIHAAVGEVCHRNQYSGTGYAAGFAPPARHASLNAGVPRRHRFQA